MTARQTVTPELQRWIVAQATAGRQPEEVLAAMCQSGWEPDVAEQALEDTLRGVLADHARAAAQDPNEAVRMPEPLSGDGSLTLAVAARASAASNDAIPASVATARAVDGAGATAADTSIALIDEALTRIRVVTSLVNPRVVVFSQLLSDDECDELIELARPRLARSETVATQTGGSEVNEARTSQGMFFDRGENALCARIEQRIASLLDWPLENGEGLQILRYQPGAEYRPHYDYFDPEQPGTPAVLARGGQRVASLVMYLNTPRRGGATVFPDVGFDVAPVKGNAVFFSYDRPHPATKSLHGGAPVIEGEKWVATKWLRERRFD
jgi:prolyl 4-hydroxylase